MQFCCCYYNAISAYQLLLHLMIQFLIILYINALSFYDSSPFFDYYFFTLMSQPIISFINYISVTFILIFWIFNSNYQCPSPWLYNLRFWYVFKYCSDSLGHSFHCFQNYIFKCLIYHFHNFIFQCLDRSCIVVLILWPVSCLLYHCYSSTFFKSLWLL